MGLIDGLGRLIQGKPVFRADDERVEATDEPDLSSSEKVVPKVCVIRSECRINNGHMELIVHIKNESSIDVCLENIRIFDKIIEIGKFIKPAETHDFIVYNGPVMQDEHRNKCELKYRKTDGNFFVMHHIIEYGYRHNTYEVDAIKPIGNVNDI